ncbi:DC-STAMP domain-containing protein 2-like [Brevipalpus obovatus]|uniref:DC-STAMP domain-containing protein 2-like n=1 Tax=Brevipalpus obovatus TaxID=246614 RepID=UPI003D9E75EF
MPTEPDYGVKPYSPHDICPGLERRFPRTYYICFRSKRSEYQVIRRISSIPFSILAGYGISKLLMIPIPATSIIRQFLSPALMVMVAIVYCSSIQFRALSWLILPLFFARNGFNWVFINYLLLIANGPCTGILHNTYQAARLFTSSLIMQYNITSLLIKNVMELSRRTIIAMQESQSAVIVEVKKADEEMKSFDDKVLNREGNELILQRMQERDKEEHTNKADRAKKFFKEQEKADNSSGKWDAKLRKTLELKCENISSLSVADVCKGSFDAGIEKASSEEIREHLKREKKKTCKDNEEVDADGKPLRNCSFTDILADFASARDFLGNFLQDVKDGPSTKIMPHFYVPQYFNFTAPEDLKEQAKIAFSFVQAIMNFVMKVLRVVAEFFFLCAIFQANTYHNDYLLKIYQDNRYITAYFHHIDARRVKSGKYSLLPLRSSEKVELQGSFDGRLTLEENRGRIRNLTTFLPILLSTFILCVLDYFLADILEQLRINYRQVKIVESHMYFHLSIKGNGSLAEALKKRFSTINTNESTYHRLSNEYLLPDPRFTSPSDYTYLSIYGFLIIIYIFCQPYMLRLRRIICAYFYPKREKQRILYLYNDCLKKRRQYDANQVEQLRRLVKTDAFERNVNILHFIADLIPFCKCLRYLSPIPCAICEEKVYERKERHKCANCGLRFCIRCWNTCQGVCPACYEYASRKVLKQRIARKRGMAKN